MLQTYSLDFEINDKHLDKSEYAFFVEVFDFATVANDEALEFVKSIFYYK